MSSEIIIRKIKSTDKKVFLTFDDGPSEFTNEVLSLLDKYQAKATFFVVGTAVNSYPLVFQKIMKAQHSIFSHSIDHNFRNYFYHDHKIRNWLVNSLSNLSKKTGQTSRLFRPPAGIVTPPLKRIAKKEGIKLILWNYRFYDSVLRLNNKKIQRYLKKARPGDIVLLHDTQPIKHQADFLIALDGLLHALTLDGYTFGKLQETDL